MFREDYVPLLVVGETALGERLRKTGFDVAELPDGERLLDHVWCVLQGPVVAPRAVGAIVQDGVCHPDALCVVESLRDEGWNTPVVVTRPRATLVVRPVAGVEIVSRFRSTRALLRALCRAGASPAELGIAEPGSRPAPSARARSSVPLR